MRDLDSIRPTNDAIDEEFSPARREEILDAVMAARSAVTPLKRRRPRWPVGLAAAVAVVAAAALAVQVLGGMRGPLVAEPVPPTATSASPFPSPSAPPGTPATSPLETLTVIADAAAATKPIAQGTFLHTLTSEELSEDPAGWNLFDSYVDADGWTWTRRTGSISSWALTSTSTTMGGLPTDPAALDAEARGLGGTNSGDERVYQQMVTILRQPGVAADLRSAALRVLQRLAREPQLPETTKDGLEATPRVTVTNDLLGDEGEPRWRVTLTDQTSRPGAENWIILDGAGIVVEQGVTGDGSTFTSVVAERSVVTALPTDFVESLGTEHVEQSFEE